MPCRDDYPTYEETRLKERLDNVTCMLCTVMKCLEEHNFLKVQDPEVLKWWAEHKRAERLWPTGRLSKRPTWRSWPRWSAR